MKRVLPGMLGWLIVLIGLAIVVMSHFFVSAGMNQRFGMMVLGALVLAIGIFLVYRSTP